MKKSGCLMVFLFVAVCASMFVNLLLLAALGARGTSGMAGVKLLKPKTFEERVLVDGAGSSSKVAVIPLEGVIAFGAAGSLGNSMVEDFKAALEQAENDKQIKAVVLQVDSPGGEITASDVLYDAICRLARHKPVVVYFNSIGASGAYYAACGANWIMCNNTTFTGSIGVIINGAREMSEEEKTYVQGLVMQSYDRFVGIVARSRKLDEKELREGVADGRVLSGTDAYASRLVDELGYIEDAYEKAAELGKAPNAQIVRYERNYSFDKFFRMFGESKASTNIEVNLLPKASLLEPGRVYLLPAFFAP